MTKTDAIKTARLAIESAELTRSDSLTALNYELVAICRAIGVLQRGKITDYATKADTDDARDAAENAFMRDKDAYAEIARAARMILEFAENGLNTIGLRRTLAAFAGAQEDAQ